MADRLCPIHRLSLSVLQPTQDERRHASKTAPAPELHCPFGHDVGAACVVTHWIVVNEDSEALFVANELEWWAIDGAKFLMLEEGDLSRCCEGEFVKLLRAS